MVYKWYGQLLFCVLLVKNWEKGDPKHKKGTQRGPKSPKRSPRGPIGEQWLWEDQQDFSSNKQWRATGQYSFSNTFRPCSDIYIFIAFKGALVYQTKDKRDPVNIRRNSWCKSALEPGRLEELLSYSWKWWQQWLRPGRRPSVPTAIKYVKLKKALHDLSEISTWM